MVEIESEDEREEGFRKRARLLELTLEIRDNILSYIGEKTIEETEVYEHLRSRKLEYFLSVMLIQALSSFDMKTSIWHSACEVRYKQLYEGIERKYNPADKSYYLRKK